QVADVNVLRHRKKPFPCPVRPTGLWLARRRYRLSPRVPSAQTVSIHSGRPRSQQTIGCPMEDTSPPAQRFRGGRSDPFSALQRGGACVGGVESTPRCPASVPGLVRPTLSIFRKETRCEECNAIEKRGRGRDRTGPGNQSPDQGNLNRRRLFY